MMSVELPSIASSNVLNVAHAAKVTSKISLSEVGISDVNAEYQLPIRCPSGKPLRANSHKIPLSLVLVVFVWSHRKL